MVSPGATSVKTDWSRLILGSPAKVKGKTQDPTGVRVSTVIVTVIVVSLFSGALQAVSRITKSLSDTVWAKAEAAPKATSSPMAAAQHDMRT